MKFGETTTAEVLVAHAGPVCRITINRPEARNALNASVADGIRLGIVRASARPDCRVIVLTGASDKAFCAGADLGRNARGSAFAARSGRKRHFMAALLKTMDACPLPIIARVNGHALAGGFGLLCACDLAVSVDGARFGLPEVRVGLAPALILSAILRVVPRRKLHEMALTGEPIDAREALALGIVNHVTKPAALDRKLDWLVERLVASSPTGQRLAKKALRAMDRLDLDEALAFGQRMVRVMAATADAQEGMQAFREKRKPVWPKR